MGPHRIMPRIRSHASSMAGPPPSQGALPGHSRLQGPALDHHGLIRYSCTILFVWSCVGSILDTNWIQLAALSSSNILPHVGTQWRSSGQSFVHRTNLTFIGTLLLPTLILAPLEGPSAFIRSLLGTPYGSCWISHGFVGLHKLT